MFNVKRSISMMGVMFLSMFVVAGALVACSSHPACASTLDGTEPAAVVMRTGSSSSGSSSSGSRSSGSSSSSKSSSSSGSSSGKSSAPSNSGAKAPSSNTPAPAKSQAPTNSGAKNGTSGKSVAPSNSGVKNVPHVTKTAASISSHPPTRVGNNFGYTRSDGVIVIFTYHPSVYYLGSTMPIDPYDPFDPRNVGRIGSPYQLGLPRYISSCY